MDATFAPTMVKKFKPHRYESGVGAVWEQISQRPPGPQRTIPTRQRTSPDYKTELVRTLRHLTLVRKRKSLMSFHRLGGEILTHGD